MAIPIVTIKDASILFDPVTPAHVYLLSAAQRAAAACNISLVISCAREAHGHEDPHSRGMAIDISVAGLSAPMIVRVKTFLVEVLGPAWTVLFETPLPIDPVAEPQLVAHATVNRGATARHLHCQPVKGTVWPPVVTPAPSVPSVPSTPRNA